VKTASQTGHVCRIRPYTVYKPFKMKKELVCKETHIDAVKAKSMATAKHAVNVCKVLPTDTAFVIIQ